MQDLLKGEPRRSAAGKKLATRNAGKSHPLADLEAVLELLRWSILQRGTARPPDLDELVKALYGRFFWIAFQVFKARGSRNPEEDAKEAVQDWVVKLLDGSTARYNGRTPFYVYVYPILVNACLTSVRKSVRNQTDQLPFDVVSRGVEPEQAAERNEARVILRREMRTLPKQVRRVLIAKYWLDLKSRPAATHLGMTESTVNRKAHEGRTELKGRLQDKWPGCRPF